jgi:hypothetical protein
MADSIQDGAPRPPYEAPKLTVMSEAELLKSFQITSAAATWWGM